MESKPIKVWRPRQASTFEINPLEAANRTHSILAPKNIPSDFLGKLKKTKFYRVYQNHLKNYSLAHGTVQWLWKNAFPIYLRHISPLLTKDSRQWRSLVPFSKAPEKILEHHYHLIDKAIVETIKPTVYPSQNQHYLDVKHDRYTFPKIFVLKVENTQIHGGTNLILTKNQVLCHDLYHFDEDYTSEELHGRIVIQVSRQRIRWILHDKTPVTVPIAATFVDSCALNYAHWLTEVLPRICLFCSDNRFKDIPIIVNSQLHDNLKKSIFMLVGDREVIFLPIGRAINVERLYVMSPTGYIPFEKRPNARPKHASNGIFSPDAIQLLRKRVTEKLPITAGSDFPKKIYLRRTSNTRKLLNESEIESILIKRGFSIIATELLDFTEQVALFQNADIIIGPTGAACANIIFCHSQAKIAILMAIHENMPYRYWLNMSNAAGVKQITYILGEITQNKSLGFHADYKIDTNELLSYLEQLENA